jgi:peptidoglycan/LPS O-acetylase OafA/YrhL
MKTNHQRQRLEVLDLARGVGFLVVLLQHCLGSLGITVPGRYVPQDATVLDFFFLMSGFFAGYALEEKLRTGRTTIAQAVTERAVRLRPLVALGMILGLISMLISAPGNDAVLPLLVIALKGFVLIPADGTQFGSPDLFPLDGPLWFLLYDWFAYLLFLYVLRHLSLKWLMAIAAISASGLWWAAISKNTLSFGTLWADCGWSIPRSLAGFTIGYILFRLYKPNRFQIGPRFGFVPVLVLLTAVLLPVSVDWRYSGALQALIATTVMPVIVFFGAYVQAGAITARLARFAAKMALPVYVLHNPLVRTLGLLRWDFHLHGAAGAALFLMQFLVPVLLAFLVATYLDVPLRSFTNAHLRGQSPG